MTEKPVAEFYVKSTSGKLVPAQYLRDRGTRIVDPNPNATKYILYDRNGNALANQNVGNYYIVPDGYSLDNARNFGDDVRSKGGEKQSLKAIELMREAFWTGGSQDWQRQYTYADGTPGDPDDPVPAFRRSTSFILGFVTARSGIPEETAVIGGGSLNRLKDVLYSILGLFRDDKNNPDIDTSGSYGNNPENERSIEHGFRHSKASAVPWDRAHLEEQRNVADAAPASAPLRNQNGLNDLIQEGRVGGRGVEYAFYRKTPFAGPVRMTPAMRALTVAKADDAFTKRYLKGDRDAVDRMHALHRAAYPEPSDATVRPAVRPVASDTSADGFSTDTRDMTPARQALETAKLDNGFVKRYLDGDRNAFDQMQSLIKAAYPEPDDSGTAGNVRQAPRDTSNKESTRFAPWFGDALGANALRDEGTDPTITGWLGDWRDELRRRD
jgi:hypothetical protein